MGLGRNLIHMGQLFKLFVTTFNVLGDRYFVYKFIYCKITW